MWALGIALGGLSGIAAAAVALNGLYLLSHEGHHHLLFSRPWLNDAVNTVLCAPLLHSARGYRVLHELHHRFLRGPGDPDEYSNYTRDRRLQWALQWVRLTIGTLVYMPLIPIVSWRRASATDRKRLALELSLIAAAVAAAFAILPLRILLQGWLIPGVIVGYISAVRALAQHALTSADDPLLSSRCVRSNPVVAFLLLNENYHLEHHLFPEVPSYSLPRLHALLHARLPRRIEAGSYTGFLARFVGRSLRGDDSPLGVVAP